MSPEMFIDRLLAKYQQAPSFPFLDWATNPVSFYAAINLWDDLFRAAAGSKAEEFRAARDVQMDPDSRLYEVINDNQGFKVNASYEEIGGTFYLYGQDADDGFPCRTYLGFATDLDRDRLVACFEIIQLCVHAEIASPADADLLKRECVVRHRRVFGFPDYDPFENYDEDGRYVEPPDDEE